ncbi:2967_t:CDS:2 [Ambispora gerdemannii]|uniref:2967_t:CDS:1 n=1 Tax=Ambispora gerdemannii TaxID=144530 RepID=A0A9N9FY98_9GLOM|nr:2967_t:CDS:2 [Ambispora gerdemannii]
MLKVWQSTNVFSMFNVKESLLKILPSKSTRKSTFYFTGFDIGGGISLYKEDYTSYVLALPRENYIDLWKLNIGYLKVSGAYV